MRNFITIVLTFILNYNCLAFIFPDKQKSEEPAQINDTTLLRTRKLMNSLSQKSPNIFANAIYGNDTTKLEGYIDESKSIRKLLIKGTNNEGGYYIESVFFDNNNENIIFSITYQNMVLNTIFKKNRDVVMLRY